MELQVLLSCMSDESFSLVETKNIESKVLIINQNKHKNKYERITDKVEIYHVIDSGLTKSRNMDLSKTTGDILLLSDDDVSYFSRYEDLIISEFKKHLKRTL